MIMGGEISGGSALTTVCAIAATSASAPAKVGFGLKKDVDDADTIVGLADDTLDAFHRRGQGAFEVKRDASGHLRSAAGRCRTRPRR